MWQPVDPHVTIIVGLLLWLTKFYLYFLSFKGMKRKERRVKRCNSSQRIGPAFRLRPNPRNRMFVMIFFYFLLLALTRVFWRFLSCIIISAIKNHLIGNEIFFFLFLVRKGESHLDLLMMFVFFSFSRLATPSTLGWRGRWIFPSPRYLTIFHTWVARQQRRHLANRWCNCMRVLSTPTENVKIGWEIFESGWIWRNATALHSVFSELQNKHENPIRCIGYCLNLCRRSLNIREAEKERPSIRFGSDFYFCFQVRQLPLGIRSESETENNNNNNKGIDCIQLHGAMMVCATDVYMYVRAALVEHKTTQCHINVVDV